MNFAEANHDLAVSLTSKWTPHFKTNAGESSYRVGGINSEKASVSVTGISSKWGALTISGALAHDNAVIPKHETVIAYDQGWRISSHGFIRGLEIECGPHWYWYTTARILTMNQIATLYLPNDWIWSLGVTNARSSFSTGGAEWRPSGMSRLNFPLGSKGGSKLFGRIFFAAGTENFSRVDQIGHFSSQTYGGGLRLEFTSRQDVTGTAAFQKRTLDRTETSFGFQYGIRF